MDDRHEALPEPADLIERLLAQVENMPPEQIRAVADQLMGARTLGFALPPRPDLRRPRREEVRTYRLRLDLAGAKPPIWRRLEADSHLSLAELHTAIQIAFGWYDYHLHRFALGGSVWDRDSQLFLCSQDLDNPEFEGDVDGLPEGDVRLDEVLTEAGDRLSYVYDYGDDWDLRIRLESVTERTADAAPVRCVGGRRAGPPEDSGGVYGYLDKLAAVEDTSDPEREELAEWLGSYAGGEPWDPAHFDAEEVDAELAGEFASAPRAAYHSPVLGELLTSVKGGPSADALKAVAVDAHLDEPAELSEQDAERLVRRYVWLLARVGDGLELTKAGHLRPADVRAAMDELGLDRTWIGKGNREELTWPVLSLRETAQRLGLVRKQRGELRPVKAVRAMAGDPLELCRHIATRLPLGKPGTSEPPAGAVLLALVAAERDVHGRDSDAYALIGSALTDLGWRVGQGDAVPSGAARQEAGATLDVLDQMEVFEPAAGLLRGSPTPAAVRFARLALRSG
ncbi:MAG TPA: plasmid pRiA4b ORF-3 family protein [Nocardioidaceae bacterium]|nr:plasmid pRiA4b ORF-3 family protein [Nocardioidaceae bacterium]